MAPKPGVGACDMSYGASTKGFSPGANTGGGGGGGGNCGVWVGVFGEESCSDSGDRSTSIGSGLMVPPEAFRCVGAVVSEATSVAPSLIAESPSWADSANGDLKVGDLMYVAWLDVLDLIEILDLSSARDVDRETNDVLDLGRSSLRCSLLLDLAEAGVPERCSLGPERFVSGGLGGRSSGRALLLRDDEDFRTG